MGVITAAHGIKGEVKLKSYTDNPVDIFALPSLCDAEGNAFSITKRGVQKKLFITVIEGVADRNRAEELKGTTLYAPREDLPDLDDGEFYVEDLIGLDVVLQDTGEKFGTLVSVQNFGASDLMEIEDLDGNREYYALTEETFPEWDEEKIVFCPAEVI